ncbi:MAG: hypothetical protein DI543_21085 [Bradyrhizobium icense]|nr:MAG: hypothetical protein DI543_21085 [Bradyrhizobium icense]
MPDEAEGLKLQAQLLELASTVRRLQQAGQDSAVAELKLRRRRAELEDFVGRERAQGNGQGSGQGNGEGTGQILQRRERPLSLSHGPERRPPEGDS